MQQNNPEKRLWFIELIAWWEGKINASALISQFAISRVQAQQDIKRYQQQAPDNLRYCASSKGFIPTTLFQPGFINGDVIEYLNWLGQYLLQELQVNLREQAISPEAQQLVVVNIDEVKPWLFDYKT